MSGQRDKRRMRLYEDRPAYLPLASPGSVMEIGPETFRVKGPKRWWVVQGMRLECECKDFKKIHKAQGTECAHLRRLREYLETPRVPEDDRHLRPCTRCGREIDITGLPVNNPRRYRCPDCRYHANHTRRMRDANLCLPPTGSWLTTPAARCSPSVPDIHWIAGFLEGEGCFGITDGNLRIAASQTSLEPLEKLQGLLGGTVREFQRKNRPEHHKEQWIWSVNGVRAFGVAFTLYALLTKRRQTAIRDALAAFRAAAAKRMQNRSRTRP